jgi:hypothetical protein
MLTCTEFFPHHLQHGVNLWPEVSMKFGRERLMQGHMHWAIWLRQVQCIQFLLVGLFEFSCSARSSRQSRAMVRLRHHMHVHFHIISPPWMPFCIYVIS